MAQSGAFFLHKRVLVTGASGFIGRHLVSRLLAHGAEIASVSRNRTDLPPEVRQYAIDIRDPAAVDDCIRDCRPEYIFHLAAYKERTESIPAFYAAIETNLTGSLNLFAAAKHPGPVRSIVTLGTAEEYGNTATPFSEQARESPVTPYSFSKVCVTHLAELFFQLYRLPVVVVRPTLAYGPGQGPEMFLPALIASLVADRPFEMTPGGQTRDFVYVADLVDALVLAAAKEQAHGQVINIGSGTPVKLVDIALLTEKMMGKSGLVRAGSKSYRHNEIMEYAVSTKKAEELLGWRPATTLEAGLSNTIDYYAGKRCI
jgi:UDP-glucose 4-epimerase